MARDGFLNLIKPPGMTSHDLVAMVRARQRARRVGHLGTLDPAAAGVLPVAIGRATRLFQFATGRAKCYRAELVFGVATDTYDAEGQVVARSDDAGVTHADLKKLLEGFVGEIVQRPPAFSAARLHGERLYDLARKGAARAGRPRKVRIEKLELLDYHDGPPRRALIEVTCSTGTYVRSLAHEIGCAAGCGAYLGFLLRTAAGRFALADAVTIEEFDAAHVRGEADGLVYSIDFPLEHVAAVELSTRAAQAFAHGTRVCAGDAKAWPVRVYGPNRSFIGIGEVVGEGVLCPRMVLAPEHGEGECG